MHEVKTKFIVVTGGVLSGLGKGIATASIARLIKSPGMKVVNVKCDGYLNVDPGTMNPFEHGEVFVLDDGGEVDMDFGHYERFLDVQCRSSNNLTSGKMFKELIDRERKGDFLGKTVQIIPHFVEHICSRFLRIAKEQAADVLTIEIGGTVGDIENSWFIEAAKRLKRKVGSENILYVHLTFVPKLANVGEFKTKPAQRDVMLVRSLGINPDILVCRSETYLSEGHKKKIAGVCEIPPAQIVSGIDVDSIYSVPLMFAEQGLQGFITKRLALQAPASLDTWRRLVENITSAKRKVTIAICGKYTGLEDSYASVKEALVHAGANLGVRMDIEWVETTGLKEGMIPDLLSQRRIDGILVPGGFGSRGTEGKIALIKYAREHNIPYLGICYGLQLAVIEFARSVCGLEGAGSSEIGGEVTHKVVDILPGKEGSEGTGGTMRLGSYSAVLKEGSLVAGLYGSLKVVERHRHRYEVNPGYHGALEGKGLVFSGISADGRLVEFIELADHPFFVASQGHNEFTSRLERPNPLFLGFVRAAVQRDS